MIKNLLPFIALAACVFAPTMARYSGKAHYGAAPAGYLIAQRIEPSYNAAYSAPLPYAPAAYAPAAYAPAVYPNPAGSYGVVKGPGYDNNAQIHSLTKLALALPVPVPDGGKLGGYGGKQASYVASPRAAY